MFKILFLTLLFLSNKAFCNEKTIILASTTSTYDSGLLDYINTEFKKFSGIYVKVLSQGTGQALRTAMDGNVEIVMVHHKESELEFMKLGYGIIRHELMYNDYIIVGPQSDNKKCDNLNDKLNFIFSNNIKFISRSDDSGTHKKELELWGNLKISSNNLHSNYYKVGQGMGSTLMIANEFKAYTLSDRATWISFNKKENLKIICEFKPPLLNQYGIILVNPKINDNLDYKSAKIYVDWLISDRGKKLINNFKKNDEQLFYYNYK